VDKTYEVYLFIEKVPPFSVLKPTPLRFIAENMRKETYPAETRLIRQGDLGDKLYVIKSGQVKVVKTDETGSRDVATLGPREIFGEAALVDDKPRNATVVAQSEVELYSLSGQCFQDAMDENEDMRKELIKFFCQRYGNRPG
jgi:CRP-like cAMP-binding protein